MDRLLSMQVFVKVVDQLSFSKVAESMEQSTAMVSRHIAYLERHVGARLLNRTTRISA